MATSIDVSAPDDFHEVFCEFYPRLRSYFLSQGFSPFDAEDLSQTTVWNVYRSEGQFRGEGSYAAWVYTVARNAARDEWRRKGRAPEIDSLDRPLGEEGGETLAATVADERPSAAEDAAGREELALTLSALSALPARMRACLLLHVQQGLSYTEVARRLTLSVPTVKVQIWNARRRLRRHLVGAV